MFVGSRLRSPLMVVLSSLLLLALAACAADAEPTPAPSPTPTDPLPTATPTAEPSPTPTEPAPTPEPTPTATPEPHPTPTPDEPPTNGDDPADPGEVGADLYIDPQGRYSAPLPANWTVTQHEGFATLAGPGDLVRVHLTAMEGDDVTAAIAQAWQRVDLPIDLEIENTFQPPPPTGVDETVIHHYRLRDEHLAQAVGQLVDEVVYVALMEGSLAEVQRRAAQVQIVVTGFRPAALERIDLSDVEPIVLTDEHLAELESFVEEAMSVLDIPGASIGVVQDGQVVWEQGFGVREAGGEAPVTPQTLMMIGSTTKTMTTLMLATLVDEGVISWDTPAHEILPEFQVQDPELTEAITVRNLVCACTGVPRRDLEIIFNFQELTAEDVMDSLATFEFFTDFGEAFQYSNQMVAAAGYVGAAALTSPYGELYDGYVAAMQERIFSPIGMADTTIAFDEALAAGDHALPHALNLDVSYEAIDPKMERFVEPVAPAGAAWSNTQSMTRYLLTMLGQGVTPEGERIVSVENLEEMWQPQIGIAAEDSYGLGWIVSNYHGQRMISHGGNTMGFTSELAFLPEAGVGITVLANGGMANALTNAVRSRLMEIVFDLPPAAAQQLQFGVSQNRQFMEGLSDRLADTLDLEAVEPYLGRYTNPYLGDITLEMRDGLLYGDAGEFASGLRQSAEAEGLEFMIVEPPLLGGVIRASTVEGEQQLQIGEGIMVYTFKRVE